MYIKFFIHIIIFISSKHVMQINPNLGCHILKKEIYVHTYVCRKQKCCHFAAQTTGLTVLQKSILSSHSMKISPPDFLVIDSLPNIVTVHSLEIPTTTQQPESNCLLVCVQVSKGNYEMTSNLCHELEFNALLTKFSDKINK